MSERIVDHVWRPPGAGRVRMGPSEDRPCEYMNCRRPRSEHRWASRTRKPAEAGAR